MPSVYSDAHWTGTYTYTRVRVDYSGTSATAVLLYTRTNTYSGATSAGNPANFTFSGVSASFANKTFYGQQSDAEVCRVSFTISTSGGTYSGSTSGDASLMAFSGSVTIPAQSSAPTGLYRTNTVANPESVTATIGVTGWGAGGSTAQHYVEMSVCESNNTSTRSYRSSFIGDSLSDSITVDNTVQYVHLTIVPNQRYYLTQYASNGAVGVGNSSFEAIVTPCKAPTLSSGTVTDKTATIDYVYSKGGQFYTTKIAYSLDNGTTWTVSQAGTAQGSLNLTGLTPDTSYTIQAKVQGYDGDTAKTNSAIATLTFRTLPEHKLYGAVSGKTKKIKKLYGSVNGQTKLIKKLYGSVNGVTKRIY